MRKVLSVFVAIIWACQGLEKILSLDQNIGEVYSSGLSSVPILKDDLGFYVNVHLTNNTNDTADTVPMELGFFIDYTMLFDKCLAYTSYNCSKYSCTTRPWYLGAVTPSFTGFQYPANATLYLGNNNWGSQSDIWVVYGCYSLNKWLGLGRSGIIGMATQVLNARSLYSIYINQDKSQGELIFGFNPNYAQSKTPLFTIEQAGGGGLYGYSSTIQIGNLTFNESFSNSYMFDLNSDSIGLPYASYPYVYQNVIFLLEIQGPMTCTDDINYPICLYQGRIKDLPIIYLNAERDDNTTFSIPIPPQVYVVNGKDDDVVVSTITLNFRALASNLTGRNYQGNDYNTMITLGYSFLDYYYIFYNKTESTYSFYLANHNNFEEDELAHNLEELDEKVQEEIVSLDQGLESFSSSGVDSLEPDMKKAQEILDSIIEFNFPEFRGLFRPF